MVMVMVMVNQGKCDSPSEESEGHDNAEEDAPSVGVARVPCLFPCCILHSEICCFYDEDGDEQIYFFGGLWNQTQYTQCLYIFLKMNLF